MNTHKNKAQFRTQMMSNMYPTKENRH